MAVAISTLKYKTIPYNVDSYLGVISSTNVSTPPVYAGYQNSISPYLIPLSDYQGITHSYSEANIASEIISNGVTSPISATTNHTRSIIVFESSEYVTHMIGRPRLVSGHIEVSLGFMAFSKSPAAYVSRSFDSFGTFRLSAITNDYLTQPEYLRFYLYKTSSTIWYVEGLYYNVGNSRYEYRAMDAPWQSSAWQQSIFTLESEAPDPHPDPILDTDPYIDIDGESDLSGDTLAIPGFPALSATSTGIIGLFAPSAAQMQALASFMWTDFGGQGTTVETILSEIVEALKRTISNPLDYVVGLNIIPSQGLSIGASQSIRFGFVDSGVSMPRLSSEYFEVDCGSLHFDALCGDTFLDYAPYSKFSIYLPYIGVKTVDANDFVGHTIGVKYHGDVVTGGITAYVTKDGSVMYQFSGSCALNIPLSSDGWGSTIAAAVQIATSMVVGAASGGPAGVGAAAAMGAANVASNPSLLSPQVGHSGAVSGSAGLMAVQTPYIIREAVRFHPTTHFNKFTGYPAFYFRNLGDVTGFTTVYDILLENIPGTNEEVDEILSLLKGGVVL